MSKTIISIWRNKDGLLEIEASNNIKSVKFTSRKQHILLLMSKIKIKSWISRLNSHNKL